MKTKSKAQIESLINVYERSIGMWSDVSLYGPPTKTVHYHQLYNPETREETLRYDLKRLYELREELESEE